VKNHKDAFASMPPMYCEMDIESMISAADQVLEVSDTEDQLDVVDPIPLIEPPKAIIPAPVVESTSSTQEESCPQEESSLAADGGQLPTIQ
jgi:hypothetical protein